MARRNSGDLLKLILLLIAAIAGATKFLVEVNKRGLWLECILSTSLLVTVNYLDYRFLEPDKFFILFFFTLLFYCVYWGITFDRNSRKQFSNHRLKENALNWQKQEWWWNLDGWKFEEEVSKLFILQGYKATVTKGSGDGGVDIILEKDGKKTIVQCKHHKNPVPPEPIRALWGCKDDFQADDVILVASNGITQSGAEFISNKPNFKVLNLDDIIKMSEKLEV